MNIFVLDQNPIIAARLNCDKHICKIILESAQMLCTAHFVLSKNVPKFISNSKWLISKSFRNNPVAKWVRESEENYKWASEHAMELCREYTYRYNKIHKSQTIIEWCYNNNPPIDKKNRTPFIQAMPDKYKRPDPVRAYMVYYNNEKKNFANWTKRNTPLWFPRKGNK